MVSSKVVANASVVVSSKGVVSAIGVEPSIVGVAIIIYNYFTGTVKGELDKFQLFYFTKDSQSPYFQCLQETFLCKESVLSQ